jgi:hypothetical protein
MDCDRAPSSAEGLTKVGHSAAGQLTASMRPRLGVLAAAVVRPGVEKVSATAATNREK